MRVRQRRSEAPSMSAMERVRTRKKAPVTPPSITNGRKIASEQRLDPTSVGVISAMAWERPTGCSPAERAAMCSTTTIPSSSTSPTAAAIPPSVIMFSDCPVMASPRIVKAMLAGRTTAPARPRRALRRTITITSTARIAPTSRLSRTLPTEAWPALDDDLRHAGEPRQLGAQDQIGEIAELSERDVIGRHRKSEHGKEGGIHQPDINRRPGRQIRTGGLDLRLHPLHGQVEVR